MEITKNSGVEILTLIALLLIGSVFSVIPTVTADSGTIIAHKNFPSENGKLMVTAYVYQDTNENVPTEDFYSFKIRLHGYEVFNWATINIYSPQGVCDLWEPTEGWKGGGGISFGYQGISFSISIPSEYVDVTGEYTHEIGFGLSVTGVTNDQDVAAGFYTPQASGFDWSISVLAGNGYYWFDAAAWTTFSFRVNLREHGVYRPSYSPDIRFLKPSSSVLRIDSYQAGTSSLGSGWAFVVVPRDWLNGKYIRFTWSGYYSWSSAVTAGAYIYDGEYDPANDADFPEGGNIPNKGAGLLQTLAEKTTTGSWGPETVGVAINVGAGTQSKCTIFFRMGDAWIGQRVYLDIDWFEILKWAPVPARLYVEPFEAGVAMERTGTYKDYGYMRSLGLRFSLREHGTSRPSYSPDIRFLKPSSSVLRLDSYQAGAGSLGTGWAFMVVPRNWLNGKYVRFNWSGYFSYSQPRVIASAYIYDGEYDCSNDADFPEGAWIPTKGAGLLQTLAQKNVGGSWGPETVDVQANVAAGTQSECTIFLAMGDAWTAQTVYLDIDWFQVNQGVGGVGNLCSESFDANVVMERTGTYGDYGYISTGVVNP